jgi:hypothetical protein
MHENIYNMCVSFVVICFVGDLEQDILRYTNQRKEGEISETEKSDIKGIFDNSAGE